MGYMARKISGGDIRISKDKAEGFVDSLRDGEKAFGHISWCATVDEYREHHGEDYVGIATEMMEDYGFIVIIDDDAVILRDWGGDKIGSSWPDVWDSIAKTIDGDQVVEWVMFGEDDEVWSEVIRSNARTSPMVKIVL